MAALLLSPLSFHLLFPISLVAVMTALFARVLLSAIDSVRDSNHRVVPCSPWSFFDRTFKRKMRRVWVVWALTFSCFCVVHVLHSFGISHGSLVIMPAFAEEFVGPFGAVLLLTLFWAPRCERVWTILALFVPAGFVPYYASYPVLLSCVEGIAGNAFLAAHPSVYSAFNCAHVAIVIVLLALYWRTIRRRGGAWFRFEQQKGIAQ